MGSCSQAEAIREEEAGMVSVPALCLLNGLIAMLSAGKRQQTWDLNLQSLWGTLVSVNSRGSAKKMENFILVFSEEISGICYFIFKFRLLIPNWIFANLKRGMKPYFIWFEVNHFHLYLGIFNQSKGSESWQQWETGRGGSCGGEPSFLTL